MEINNVAKHLDFTGNVVVVTGASGGIGRRIAKRYAEAGATVVITYCNGKEGAMRAQKEIGEAKGKSFVIQLDQKKTNTVEDFVTQVVNQAGRINILVNNSGIYPSLPGLDITEDAWDEMLDTNTKGVFFLTQAVVKQMIKQDDGGAVVNIGSIDGERPVPGHLHYGASKAALSMVTRCLAQEVGQHGIRVNAVAPGLIEAPGIYDNLPHLCESYNQRSALGRIGTPRDIADACIFLSSSLADWITGQILVVDGGVLLARPY
jgi:NAD(P)-dependent dehydrogenase (short-subunit alcohol dehydrogenase family)